MIYPVIKLSRSLGVVAALVFSVASLVGCESTTSSTPPDRDLTLLEITDIELTGEGFNLSEGLAPENRGNSVRVAVKVKKPDGTVETITNPVMKQFQFTAKHMSVSTSGAHQLTLHSDSNSFDYRNEKFELSVSVAGNPFPAKQFSFAIDWTRFTSLSYSGWSGSNGSNGSNGSSLLVYVAHTKDSKGDFRAYRVTNMATGNTIVAAVPASQSLKIYTNGGNGGNGADGHHGDNSSQYYCNGAYATPFGDDSEDGQNGGNGGNAGLISVNYYSPQLLNFLSYSSTGGAGGKGGEGGKGGHGCKYLGDDGKDGQWGSSGQSTTPSFNKVSVDETKALFSSGRDLTGVEFID